MAIGHALRLYLAPDTCAQATYRRKVRVVWEPLVEQRCLHQLDFVPLNWAGLDGSDYPHLVAHNEANLVRPWVQRMIQQNADAAAHLASRGLAARFDGPGAIGVAR